MGFITLGIFLFAVNGFLQNLREKSNEEDSVPQQEGKPIQNTWEIVKSNETWSTLCFFLSACVTAPDAWLNSEFKGLVFTTVSETPRGIITISASIILLIAGALFHNYNAKKKVILVLCLLLGGPLMLLQNYLITEREIPRIEKAGWFSYAECRTQIDSWEDEEAFPLVSVTKVQEGRVLFQIKPYKTDMSKIVDWKTEIFLSQDDYNELDLKLQREGYETVGEPKFILVGNVAKAQSTWIKKKHEPQGRRPTEKEALDV